MARVRKKTKKKALAKKKATTKSSKTAVARASAQPSTKKTTPSKKPGTRKGTAKKGLSPSVGTGWRRLEYQDAKSSKFWQIRLTGSAYAVRFGRIGSAGQDKTKEFGSRSDAKAAAEKLIAQKLKKGYVEVSAAKGTASAPQASKSRPAPGRGATARAPIASRTTEPTEAALSATLSRLKLADCASELSPFAYPEIGLIPDPDATPTMGCSRLGGIPDLPAGFEWPTHRWPLREVETWSARAQEEVRDARRKKQVWDEGGDLVAPIAYLCQIDLEAVHPCDLHGQLPSSGLLVFFASQTIYVKDPLFTKRVASAVRFVSADRSALVATPPPPTPEYTMTGSCALRTERRVAWDIPFKAWDDLRIRTKLPKRKITALFKESEAEVHALLAAPTRKEHHTPMPPPGEVVLLRLFSQFDLDFCIGDAGWMTFAIPEADLQAHRFEAARASVFID